jgi:tyrosinase
VGNFWTPNSARSVTTFGYTYPELVSGAVADVKTAVNTLYGSSLFSSKKRSVSSEAAYDAAPDTANRVYRLIFKAPKGRLPSTYTIYFFLGDPTSETPIEWSRDPNLLGSQAFLQGPAPGPAVQPVTVTGVVPLNSVLESFVADGRLYSLKLNDVLGLLTGGVTFRVMMVSCLEVQ